MVRREGDDRGVSDVKMGGGEEGRGGEVRGVLLRAIAIEHGGARAGVHGR